MNKRWLITGGLLIVLILGATQLLSPRSAVSPTLQEATSTSGQSISTPTPPVITTATVNITNHSSTSTPKIAVGDNVASWDFVGTYANDPELITKAQTEIKRLSGLIGKGTYPDVSLYVGIANQYELLGKGKQQYEYLDRAIKASGTTGLPWHNLGVLMERLGALETARIAHKESTLIQPELKQWHYSYLEFLTTRMKENVTDIEKEFAAALKNLGQDADILRLYSEWKNS